MVVRYVLVNAFGVVMAAAAAAAVVVVVCRNCS